MEICEPFICHHLTTAACPRGQGRGMLEFTHSRPVLVYDGELDPRLVGYGLSDPGEPCPKKWIENLVFLFMVIEHSTLDKRSQSPLDRGCGRQPRTFNEIRREDMFSAKPRNRQQGLHLIFRQVLRLYLERRRFLLQNQLHALAYVIDLLQRTRTQMVS